jgi:hypothetical protein
MEPYSVVVTLQWLAIKLNIGIGHFCPRKCALYTLKRGTVLESELLGDVEQRIYLN